MRIIIPTVTIFVVLVVALNLFLSFRFSALSGFLINEKLISNTNSLKNYLGDCEANSRAAALSMASNARAVEAIKERDRREILRIFTPTHDLYQISFYTICDADGFVLARTYSPDQFGDNVLSQHSFREALAGNTITNFEEAAMVKVSLRTGTPVYDADGALVGAILAGVRFDLDSEVERLKEIFHSEITVFLGSTRVATTITKNGQSIVGTELDSRIGEVVIQNRREYSGDADILGEKYKTFYMPLLNAGGDAFATFFLGIPEAEVISAVNSTMYAGLALGFGGLLISILLLYKFISSISKPITRLSGDMESIANGALDVDIQVKGEDEVGLLGASLQRVADILYKLIDDINMMISEQRQGNTDYSLDAGEFLGDYKVLAENILELAALGNLDQLTGIPNRRSFDNRLEMEWGRAIRDHTPISILMIDVDKFKNYNDAFGHQQGDVALKTVARVLRQSGKRSIDFAARWGGEEFVVLLPGTDAQGAVTVAENIREEVGGTEIPCADAAGAKVTISVGVNTQTPTSNSLMSGFISGADAALYQAKGTGRNRVCLHDGRL